MIPFASGSTRLSSRNRFGDDNLLGEEEIISLDGEGAFLFAARIRGLQLASREWEWDDEHLVNLAIGRCGKERVENLLDHSNDKAIVYFATAGLSKR